MKTKLYKEIASRVVAIHNCQVAAERESNLDIYNYRMAWRERHSEIVLKLLDLLPSGSGLDNRWFLDVARSDDSVLHLSASFHAMDEYGGYDRWIDFRVTVRPSLGHDLSLTIVGNFGKYQDIKEYLYQIIDPALHQEIELVPRPGDEAAGIPHEERKVAIKTSQGAFIVV